MKFVAVTVNCSRCGRKRKVGPRFSGGSKNGGKLCRRPPEAGGERESLAFVPHMQASLDSIYQHQLAIQRLEREVMDRRMRGL